MTDEQRLEAITSCFIHGLLIYPMNDLTKYAELAKRLAALLDGEIKFQTDLSWNKSLMEAWGPTSCN